jgi:ADP-ribose pyrophosphatase
VVIVTAGKDITSSYRRRAPVGFRSRRWRPIESPLVAADSPESRSLETSDSTSALSLRDDRTRMTERSRDTEHGVENERGNGDERASGNGSDDESNAGTTGSEGDDPLAWETIDSTVAYRCPGFSIRHENVRLPDGSETDFDYLAEPPAVVILPLASDGEVVLIEEWRQTVGRVNRGLPAGTVESEDEGLETAARRELREETGYESDRLRRLVTIEPANGVADSVHHYFLAEECAPTGAQDLDTDESIRVLERSYEAFREAVRTGGVRDGRAVLALAFYELIRER